MDGTSAAVNITKILGYRINYYTIGFGIVLLLILFWLLNLNPVNLIISSILYYVLLLVILNKYIDNKKILFMFWLYFILFGINIVFINYTYLVVIIGAIYIVGVFVLIRYILGDPLKSLLFFLIANFLVTIIYLPNLIAIKSFLLSEVVWLLVMFSISYSLDRSIRSIFGVSLVEVFSGFFFQWFYDDKRLERALKKLGTKVNVHTDVFSLKVNGKIVYIVVPRFHFGPFGSIGSSRAPLIFSNILGDVIVLHSLTNHDYDLATEDDVVNLARNILNKKPSTYVPFKFFYKKYTYNNAKTHVLYFPDTTLIGLSREPNVTEDIKAEGEAILISKISSTIDNPVLYDEHNSSAEKITYFSPTSEEFQEYLQLIKKIKANLPREAKANFFKITTMDPSIGSNGINVLLMDNGKQRVALINIDGNGISEDSLVSLRKLFKKYKWTPIITTTDSHENNDVAGIINEIVLSPFDLFLIEEKLKHIKLYSTQYTHYVVSQDMTVLGSEASSKLLTFLSVSTSFVLSAIFLGLIINVLLIGLIFENWHFPNFII